MSTSSLKQDLDLQFSLSHFEDTSFQSRLPETVSTLSQKSEFFKRVEMTSLASNCEFWIDPIGIISRIAFKIGENSIHKNQPKFVRDSLQNQ
ncbi:unnamed protein product [Linum trigynum]|uniref:Uncharacterized protein n=1 Tax=Linum trigynum TaxID=586398 RepID=A0AAV2CPJ8_9ROSI